MIDLNINYDEYKIADNKNYRDGILRKADQQFTVKTAIAKAEARGFGMMKGGTQPANKGWGRSS